MKALERIGLAGERALAEGMGCAAAPCRPGIIASTKICLHHIKSVEQASSIFYLLWRPVLKLSLYPLPIAMSIANRARFHLHKTSCIEDKVNTFMKP
jgi:hypothetical protein